MRLVVLNKSWRSYSETPLSQNKVGGYQIKFKGDQWHGVRLLDSESALSQKKVCSQKKA